MWTSLKYAARLFSALSWNYVFSTCGTCGKLSRVRSNLNRQNPGRFFSCFSSLARTQRARTAMARQPTAACLTIYNWWTYTSIWLNPFQSSLNVPNQSLFHNGLLKCCASNEATLLHPLWGCACRCYTIRFVAMVLRPCKLKKVKITSRILRNLVHQRAISATTLLSRCWSELAWVNWSMCKFVWFLSISTVVTNSVTIHKFATVTFSSSNFSCLPMHDAVSTSILKRYVWALCHYASCRHAFG